MSDTVPKLSDSGQSLAQLAAIRTGRERFVKVGDPQSLFVAVGKQEGPESEHEFSNGLAWKWRRRRESDARRWRYGLSGTFNLVSRVLIDINAPAFGFVKP